MSIVELEIQPETRATFRLKWLLIAELYLTFVASLFTPELVSVTRF